MSSRVDAVFVATARALATAHGVDVDVAIEDRPGGSGARTVVGRRRSTIRAASTLTREPADVQAFTAAHEVAHVVLRHRYRTRAWPGALWAAAVSTLQVAGLIWLLHQPTHSGWATAAVVAAGFAGPLVAGLGAQLLLARRTRACETAADRQALAWGYRLKQSAMPSLAAGETRISTSRWYAPFRMHPLPADRIHPHRHPDRRNSKGTPR